MKSYTKYLTFNTKRRRELIHITHEVEDAVRESGSTMASVTVNTDAYC